MGPPAKDAPLIIVGAGVFGLSLAYELAAHRGYTNITIIDRHMPPVPDGSSVDVSRIIRSEYADPFYSQLAVEALAEWQTTDWASQYHQDGFLMFSTNRDSPYMESYRSMRKEKKDLNQQMDVFEADEVEEKVRQLYPGVQAKLKGTTAIHNTVGGWANAQQAIQGLATRCSLAGVSFVTGKHGVVMSLVKDGDSIVGVQTAAGTTIKADTVVLATGSWTNRLVPDMGHNLLATGQPVGFIQLSAAEAERVRKMPVIVNMSTGVFCFPPTPDTHQLKVARHGFGYQSLLKTSDGRTISSPKLENNAASGYLPEDAAQGLREGVRTFFPEFAEREWSRLRMCWYTDTPTGDFMVDYHPKLKGLFFATGGAGQ